jgi:hypothetical protein
VRGFEDRIAIEPCGCRTDRPTGLTVHVCKRHDLNGQKNRITRMVKMAYHNAGSEWPERRKP